MTLRSISSLPNLGTPIAELPCACSSSDPWDSYLDMLGVERMVYTQANPVSEFEAAWARLQERQKNFDKGVAEAAKLAPAPAPVEPPRWDMGYYGGRPWRHYRPPGWVLGRYPWRGYGRGPGGGGHC